MTETEQEPVSPGLLWLLWKGGGGAGEVEGSAPPGGGMIDEGLLSARRKRKVGTGAQTPAAEGQPATKSSQVRKTTK